MTVFSRVGGAWWRRWCGGHTVGVLRPHARGCVLWVWWVSVSASCWFCRGGGVGGLVGWVFGFFIVDASIFVAIVLCSHLVLVGLVGSVGVGVCVRAVSVPCCGVSLSGVSFWRRLGRGMAVGCVCGGGKL